MKKLTAILAMMMVSFTAAAYDCTRADFNKDGVIDRADVEYISSVFFTADETADLNNDGVVNAADLAILRKCYIAQ